jgi:hypothetical protein
MLKLIAISFVVVGVLFLLTSDGIAEGAEVNVVFKSRVIDLPPGASMSSLDDAQIQDAALRAFLSAYGVSSAEKLIPHFQLKDTLGITRTGEIVRLTDYSRYFILRFQDDAHADAFLADMGKSQWVCSAQRSPFVKMDVPMEEVTFPH